MATSKTNTAKTTKPAPFTVIDNSGIYAASSNGGYKQELIFLNAAGEQYRIKILSESYQSQSYATLEKWMSAGWATVVSHNPKRQYSIDVSYRPSVLQSAFAPIIKGLQEIATKF